MKTLGMLAAAWLGLLFTAAPAHAAWNRAETERFVVYGPGSETKVRAYAVKLETYDTILRLYHPGTLERKSATKVQLYMLPGRPELRHVLPRVGSNVQGIYLATNEGVFALALSDDGLGADDTVFHEYAHHFMLENFPVAYPAWVVEGFAEYFMTTDISARGIKVGGYNPGRAYSIFQEAWVPLDEVLSKSVGQIRESQRPTFYSEAWLLMHYMRSDPTRAAQLDKTIAAISKGEPPVKAFQDATGMSIAELTKALHNYTKLPTVLIKGLKTEPKVTVTRLPPSADDLLLDNLRLILGPTGPKDPATLADIRRKAARYPDDRLALSTLARAEFTLGDPAAGEAIAKRLMEAAPQDEELVLLAGTGEVLAGLRDPKERDERYRAARPLLAKAYQLDKSDFRPLYAYVLSRSGEPGFPTQNDLNAALEARALAPAVQELSVRAGMIMLARGHREEAAKLLAPVVNNPHGGRTAAQARALLEGKTPAQAADEAAKADEPPGG